MPDPGPIPFSHKDMMTYLKVAKHLAECGTCYWCNLLEERED